MTMNEKTKLYQVIYQNIENSLQDIREKTEEKKEHLCAIGLGYVAQFCGFFHSRFEFREIHRTSG